MSDTNYMTIVIKYEGDKPPITGFGVLVLGCEVTALSLCDENDRAWHLQEKLDNCVCTTED